jgi:hypothetical protein
MIHKINVKYLKIMKKSIISIINFLFKMTFTVFNL